MVLKCGFPIVQSQMYLLSGQNQRNTRINKGLYPRKGVKGLSAPKINGKMSLRASVTGEIILEMFCPKEQLLDGFRVKGLLNV